VVLFELLQLVRVFLDYLRIEYLWHALIMPLTNRNGMSGSGACHSRRYHLFGEPEIGHKRSANAVGWRPPPKTGWR
jgi:hypothetical protein